MLETELYEPVRKYLQRKGFTVRAEVRDCDIAAVKDETLLIVEMKKNFTLKLVYQALDRQSATEHVYVAVPRPENFKKSEVKNMIKLLKRLNIGLIVVSFGEKRKMVQVVFEPNLNIKNGAGTNKRKREYVLKEFYQRRGDFNVGGSGGKKLMTAYREKSLELACMLEITGDAKSSDLRKAGCDAKAAVIMRNNFYGWFENVSRGVYRLTKKGKDFLKADKLLLKMYQEEFIGLLKRERIF